MSDDHASEPLLDDVIGAIENLATVLDSEEDFTLLLQQVCLQVVRAVPGVDEASVTLVRGDTTRTAATTTDIVARLDDDQYRTGNGPCLEAAETGKLVCVAVGEAHERWPTFAADAGEHGYGSFLSAPLVVDTRFSGAINCYGSQNHGFAELDAQLLELYTAAAEAALRTFHRYLRAREMTEQLTEATQHRAVIEQAKGILMAARTIGAEEAFTVLVEQSQRENVKLREVARRFVEQITGETSA